jgi:hypothetical protein
MSKNNKTKWIVGAILFAGFLLTFFMDLTGVELHQWLGILVGLLTLYHLLTHLNWVNAVADRLFGGTSNRSRLYLLIDILLACGFAFIVGTGLLMSTWLALPLMNYEFWRINHILFSTFTLFLVALKLALHWRWIVATLRKLHVSRRGFRTSGASVSLPASPALMSRRQFLGVAGVIGAGTLVAANNAIKSMSFFEDAQANVSTQEIPAPAQTTQPAPVFDSIATPTTGNTGPTQVIPTPIPATPTVAPTSCSVRCNRHCSYPGSCRRYTDLNKNQLCDLGECL